MVVVVVVQSAVREDSGRAREGVMGRVFQRWAIASRGRLVYESVGVYSGETEVWGRGVQRRGKSIELLFAVIESKRGARQLPGSFGDVGVGWT